MDAAIAEAMMNLSLRDLPHPPQHIEIRSDSRSLKLSLKHTSEQLPFPLLKTIAFYTFTNPVRYALLQRY